MVEATEVLLEESEVYMRWGSFQGAAELLGRLISAFPAFPERVYVPSDLQLASSNPAPDDRACVVGEYNVLDAGRARKAGAGGLRVSLGHVTPGFVAHELIHADKAIATLLLVACSACREGARSRKWCTS